MKSLLELEKLGYSFYTDGEMLRYRAAAHIDTSIVMPLFEELKKHKVDAIEYLQQKKNFDLRLKYNTILTREKKLERYLDDPIRTPAEIEMWTPKFQAILNELNQLINEIGITNCSVEERMNGFDNAPYGEVAG